MRVRRKSLHRSKNGKLWKKRANQRAAKERKRIERLNMPLDADALMAEAAKCQMPKATRSGFRITIECLDDGERVSFTASRGPFGLTISATDCGRRVAAVLLNYAPQQGRAHESGGSTRRLQPRQNMLASCG